MPGLFIAAPEPRIVEEIVIWVLARQSEVECEGDVQTLGQREVSQEVGQWPLAMAKTMGPHSFVECASWDWNVEKYTSDFLSTCVVSVLLLSKTTCCTI